MTVFRRINLRISHGLLTFMLAALAIMVLMPDQHMIAGICGSMSIAALSGSMALIFAATSKTTLALAWLIMLAAMMPPLLNGAFIQIWHSNYPKRRLEMLSFFTFAYGGVWMMSGLVFIPLVIALQILIPTVWLAAILIMFSLLWSANPIAQLARNRCHKLKALRSHKYQATIDAFSFGIKHGVWCLLSCWPWMLVPLAIQDAHIIAMLMVAFVLYWERIMPPRSINWQMPPIFEIIYYISRRLKYYKNTRGLSH